MKVSFTFRHMDSSEGLKEHTVSKLDRLGRQVEEGSVTLRVAGTYQPQDASAAHARLEAGGTRGRLVIVFD